MDRARLLEARRKLGLLKETPAVQGRALDLVQQPAPQVEPQPLKVAEPSEPKKEKSTAEQAVEVQPQERPLEGFDLITENTLRMVKSAAPQVAPQPAPRVEPSSRIPSAPLEPVAQPKQPKQTGKSPLAGILTGAAGLGLVAAGVVMGGKK